MVLHMTALPFAAEVAAYLDYCAAHRGALSPRYHPTEDGAVKAIPHRRHHDREADQLAEDQIRAAYRAAAARPRRESGTSGTSGTPAGQSTSEGFRVPAGGPEPPEPSPPRRQEVPVMHDDPRAALAAAALDAAARGWHVFPVRPRVKKPPAYPDHKAADCTRRDPRCRGGHTGWETRATADPARISLAWSQAAYNVGIATGPSGLVVIDLDVAQPGEVPPPRWLAPGIGGGDDVLAALCEEHGEPFPWETFTVRTGRGGMHLYFTAPPGAALRNTSGENGGLGWLIDTRAWGGYIVAPGSVVDLPGGVSGRYEVTYDRPPAPLPAWLAALLTQPRQHAPSLECRSPDGGQVRAPGEYARAALQGESDAVRAAAEGGRTHVLNKAAYHLGQLIAAGALADDGAAETTLYEAASVHFAADRPVIPAEARATIRGGITAGKRNPRQIRAAA
jgi:hypothetical protein